jgi:ABC-type phosphate transport system permease subunit
VLAMHIYLTITEGQSMDKAFASSLVLVVLVLAINVCAHLLMGGKGEKK